MYKYLNNYHDLYICTFKILRFVSKLRSKEKIILLVLILSFALLFAIPKIKGTLDIKYTSLLPIEDTFVDSNHPMTTYGNSELLYFGDYYGKITEIFLLFEISSKYRNFTSAELQIQGVGFVSGNESHSYPVYGNVSVTSHNWEESTLMWENRPAPIKEIDSIYIGGFSWAPGMSLILYFVDVREFIQFEDGGTCILSICIQQINEEPYKHGQVAIPSKEMHNNETFFGPLLHLTYIEQPVPEFPLTPLLIGITSASGAALLVIGGYIYYKRKEKSKKQEIR